MTVAMCTANGGATVQCMRLCGRGEMARVVVATRRAQVTAMKMGRADGVCGVRAQL